MLLIFSPHARSKPKRGLSMFVFLKKVFNKLFRTYKTMEEADFRAETGEPIEEYSSARSWMDLRNLFVFLAAVLFLLSFFLSAVHVLRGIAYFLGAGAYFFELVMLTDGFEHPVPRREAFMALCFGPLYVLMGLAYLLE